MIPNETASPTMIHDDQQLQDGAKVTVFRRKPALREAGVLPKGGIARCYGVAKVHKSGAGHDPLKLQ